MQRKFLKILGALASVFLAGCGSKPGAEPMPYTMEIPTTAAAVEEEPENAGAASSTAAA